MNTFEKEKEDNNPFHVILTYYAVDMYKAMDLLEVNRESRKQ